MGKMSSVISRIRPGIAALMAKLGPKLLAVIVKFAKLGLGIGSMVAYSYLFTWQFAIILMVSLFWHESGHVWAMKKCKMRIKGIYFIPFIGAAAMTEDAFKTRKDEVFCAIMGPVWGFVMAVGTAAIYYVTKNAFFAAISGWIALINLFNLLPINPLDGGRIMKSITFSINSKLGLIFLSVGIVASIIITIWARIILFSILLAFACFELVFEARKQSNIKELYQSLKYINRYKNLPEEYKDPKITEDVNKLLEKISDIELITMPTMTTKGIMASSVSYTIIIGILWTLMNYMNAVPEVEVARKILMGL
jgi:Zn-dependent protease